MEHTMETQWKRGEFKTYFAHMKFRIGGKDHTWDIQKGDEFEYDGTIVKYSGAEFPQPGLRGAVREGWASLTEGSDDIAAVVPERNVAKAQSVNTDLSRVQRSEPRVVETTSDDENTVMDIGGRQEANQKAREAGRMAVASSDVDKQSVDGQVVGKLKSPKFDSTDVTTNPGEADRLENRTHKSSVKPQRTTEGITIDTNVGSVDGQINFSQEDEGQVIAKVRQSQIISEPGIDAQDTNGASGKKHVAKSKSNGGAKISPKLQAALDMYSDFPKDWNFFAKSDVKLSRIQELGADPEFLKALFQAEGKKFKKLLKEKYPNTFS